MDNKNGCNPAYRPYTAAGSKQTVEGGPIAPHGLLISKIIQK